MSLIRYYDLGYAETFVFDDILVNQIREGVTITPSHNTKLKEIVDRHFDKQPLVYVSNRIHSYSVDPLTYIGTSQIYNLLGIAVVSENLKHRESAAYESTFFKKPFRIFESLDESFEWARKLIQEQSD